MKALFANDNARNWEGDFKFENGKYMNKCANCEEYFLGHKHRAICKLCSNESSDFIKINNKK